MARRNIYLPDDLDRHARAAGMNVSQICQAAIAEAQANHGGVMGYQKLDYTCAGCKVMAVILPAPLGKSGLVWVPHTPGCPVKIRVAMARTRGALVKERG